MTAYDLTFTGDKPEEKGDAENYERIHGQLKAWSILTSWRMQREAFRRAMLIKANIIASDKIFFVVMNIYNLTTESA